MKWKDVFKAVYPNREFTESSRRAIILDRDKAKKIISNVENGHFPGKY
jgi:hypothetical protein